MTIPGLWLTIWGYGVWHHLQQYFSYIVAVSFRGESNRSCRRKPPTCRKILTTIITYCCIVYTSSWAGFKLTVLVAIDTDHRGSCKSTYPTNTATTTPNHFGFSNKMKTANWRTNIELLFFLHLLFTPVVSNEIEMFERWQTKADAMNDNLLILGFGLLVISTINQIETTEL